MHGTDLLSFHAAAHLAASNPGGLAILDVPGMRTRREAGMITRQGAQPSPAAVALMKLLEQICTGPDF
jgi:hypothetical protein